MNPEDNWPAAHLPDSSQTSAYVVSIVVNAILIYVAHHLLSWQVPFLTPAFADVLWAIDASLLATIFANVVFLAYDAEWFRHLVQIALNAIALGVTAILYARFPFDFGDGSLNQFAAFALLLVIFALIIAIVVEAIVLLGEVARQAV